MKLLAPCGLGMTGVDTGKKISELRAESEWRRFFVFSRPNHARTRIMKLIWSD